MLDKSSPLLFVRSLLGTNLGEAAISIANQVRDRPVDFLVIKLRDAKVTSYKYAQNTSDRVGSEQFELSYSAIEVIYTDIDPRTGSALGTVTQRFTLPASSVR